MKLLELALRLKWSSIAKRATTHPHEIAEQDDDGLTVFHWACCNDPQLHTIQVLLEEDRKLSLTLQPPCRRRAAGLTDVSGMTPLHNACACRASLEVISALVRAVPENVTIPDNDGWMALHYICCNVLHVGFQYAHDVLKELLSVGEAASKTVHHKDNHGKSPLYLLCHGYDNLFQSCGIQLDQSAREHGSTVQEFWDLVSMMVLCSCPNRKRRRHSILHCIVSIPDCPHVLIRVAMNFSPQLLRQQDGLGNTPLHLAAQSIKESSSSGIMRMLLEMDPQAARIRNHNGDLPFATALGVDGGWTSGHTRLLEAYPQALESCSLQESYYPHVLSRIKSLSTIFELLRAKPNLMQFV